MQITVINVLRGKSMAKAINKSTGFQNEIRYHTKFVPLSGVLTIHEELHWFPKTLVHSEVIKKKTTDEQLEVIINNVISRRKHNLKPFNSYDALIERGFTTQENINVIGLNGIVVKYNENSSEIAELNRCVDCAINQRTTGHIFKMAVLAGKIK